MNAGIPKGPSIRNTLNYLHYLWIKVSSYLSGSNAILCFQSDFQLTTEQMLEYARKDEIPQMEAPLVSKRAKKRRWVDIQ